jgi:trimeric autotransporter adhesin
MATQIQYRRGTDTQNNAFTGVVGEITVDTTAKTLRVHDGSTAGGSNIATVSYVDNQIGNIEANAITFGSTSMSIASSGANIVANVAGTEMAVFSASGIEVTGLLSATTTITATGNVDGGNIITAGSVSGNGRPLTSLNASNIDTGTIPDARIQSSGVTQHQANITGTGALNSGSITSGFGAIDIGASNFTTTGTYNGNGAPLTNLNGSNIASGTIASARISGSYTGITGTGALNAGSITSGFGAIDIGASNFTTTGTYNGNGAPLTNLNASNIASGTISDDRLPASISSNITGTAALATSVTITANNSTNETVYLTFVDGATGTQGLETDTGLSYNPSTNILSTTATSARYADLAEKYESDAVYSPGTVLSIGGNKEVTQSTKYADSAVVGVVSTDPAHIMNSILEAEYVVDLALTGRVPCQVVGTISKGDVLTSSDIPGVATKLQTGDFIPGCVLGKALQDYNSNEVGVIEVLVGKL